MYILYTGDRCSSQHACVENEMIMNHACMHVCKKRVLAVRKRKHETERIIVRKAHFH